MTNYNNNYVYELREKKGRDIMRSKLQNNRNIIACEWMEIDCHYDLLYSGVSHYYVVEIKYRDKYSSTATTITHKGIMMEYIKYKALLEKAQDGYIPVYIMFFNDGVGYVYTLDDTPLEWRKIQLPRKTAEDLGNIEKVVTFIPIEKCKKITFEV